MDILVYFGLPPTLTSTQSILFSRTFTILWVCGTTLGDTQKKVYATKLFCIFLIIILWFCVIGGNIDSSGNQHGESNIIMPIKKAFIKSTTQNFRCSPLDVSCLCCYVSLIFSYFIFILFFRGVCMCWRLLYVSLCYILNPRFHQMLYTT